MRLDEFVASRIVEAVVHGIDLTDAVGRETIATPDGVAFTAALLDDLLARRTVAGRPTDLSDDMSWIRAAAGRAPHADRVSHSSADPARHRRADVSGKCPTPDRTAGRKPRDNLIGHSRRAARNLITRGHLRTPGTSTKRTEHQHRTSPSDPHTPTLNGMCVVMQSLHGGRAAGVIGAFGDDSSPGHHRVPFMNRLPSRHPSTNGREDARVMIWTPLRRAWDGIESRALEVNERHASCAVGGQGPPVVFLHGWGLGHRSYRSTLVELVARGCRVYAPALPGFGGTSDLPVEGAPSRVTPPGSTPSLAPSELTSRALVIGHSFGGGVAIRLAHDAPPGPSTGADQLCGPPDRLERAGAHCDALGPSGVGVRPALRQGAVLVPRRLPHHAGDQRGPHPGTWSSTHGPWSRSGTSLDEPT